MKQKAAILFLLRIFKIGLGILNLSLSAKYFGVSVDRDIWILAFNTMIILDAALWGPINETFRTKFIFMKEHDGEVIALQRTRSLLLFTSLISLAVVIFVIIFPNLLADIIAPTYKDQQLNTLLKMIVLVAPCFLINQLVQIGISILNAYESFYIPEISSTITVILNLLLIIFLAPIIGIYALLISYYIGVILLVALIFIQIKKLNIGLIADIGSIKFKDFYPFLLFSLPFFFPYFLGQLSAVIEKTLSSSLGTGVVSLIDYSRKFTDMLMSVLLSVLTTMLVPVLSLKFAQKKAEEFVVQFSQLYQLGFLAVTCIITMFTACPEAFIDILYNKGSINAQSLHEISQLTMFYSWSTLAIYLYMVFGLVLLSSGKGKKYAFWGIMAQLLMMGTNLVLIKTVGVYVFPIASFFSHLAVAVILFYNFPFESKKIVLITLKYIAILMITAAVLYGINHYSQIGISSVSRIILSFFIMIVLMLVQVFVFKLEERVLLMNYLNKLKKYG